MKLFKKLINIICWTLATAFSALCLAFFGFLWYLAAMKRIGEIGFSAAFWELAQALSVVGAVIAGFVVVAAVWHWWRGD